MAAREAVQSGARWLARKLETLALAEVSSRSLGVIRILIAFNVLNEYTSPLAMHRIDSRPEVMVLVWVLFVANWFVMVGYKTRWSTLVWALSFGVLHLYFGRWLEEVPRMKQPALAFQCIVVLTIAPSGRSLSIDRALEVRRARSEGRDPEPERMPHWVLDLVLMCIVAVYFWAAYDKLDAAWLNGERMEMYFIKWYGSSDSLGRTPWIHELCVIAAWSTTILEFTLAAGLLFRRTRPWVVAGGYLLHIGIAMTLSVTYFSFKMMTMLFAAIPPERVHRVFGLAIDEAPDTADDVVAG